MSVNGPRPRGSPARVEPLEHLAGEEFPSAELVLLCSFAPDLNRTRTNQELRLSLHLAGYGGPQSRHLIRTSRLLRRRPGNRFALLRSANVDPASRGA